ncbi:MAG TPA: ABC transporter ATP-binding protein [Thermoplasmata archaeon]|nr:ABC transporter ATP-binding protein [Thermoplasmata archaeon]HYB77321.1 ABC transporter ATP-binding protein [Thermoplasmata archaeon]
MTDLALQSVDLRKVYHSKGAPPTEALAGVSLEVRRGERVALLGRNGAGKTTFLKIASTLLRPTSGRIQVFGFDVDETPEKARPYIAVVPQEGKPFFHLSPREQVYTYLRARGLSRETAKARTEEALDKMGLLECAGRLSVTLSGGQRQRAMVATVIATEAPLLFLDEPTIGMDPFARRSVWDSLRTLTAKGSTILLTTHYLDEAEALSHRLYIVERGRVLVTGTADDLKRSVGGTVKVLLPGGMEFAESFRTFGSCVADGDALTVIVNPERLGELMDLAVRSKLLATVGPVTLEEAFLRVVGRSIDED